MIVDTSAVLAILFREPDAERFEDSIAANWPRRMSVSNVLEASIVAEGRGGEAAGHALDRLLERAGMELVSVTAEQLTAARRAWRRFGKGNHPAALNFGDCFAYALAEVTGEALLFKGDDFSLTDIAAAKAGEGVAMSDTPIESNPDILGGVPVFSGTRVPVRILIGHLEAGDRLDEFLEDFPTVSRDQAVAVLQRAKAMLAGGAGEAAA